MIREYNEKDVNSVMRLWLETNSTAHYFIEEEYWRNNYDSVKQMLPEATIFVYEDNHLIKGFIGLNDNNIVGIFVDTGWQSHGIGKALVQHVKERNAELRLHVFQKNNRAIRFYLREGFVVEKEQMDKDTNEIELVMKWVN